MAVPATDRLITLEEFGATIGVSGRHAREIVRRAGIPYVRLGYRTFRLKLSDVEAYIATLQPAPKAAS